MKLAAAVLSAYMAMTGANADLPHTREPTSATTIAQRITTDNVVSNASTGRRRAVRHPSPPAYEAIVPLADATTDLRITNHGTGTATVQTCLDNVCKSSTLNSGASSTYTDIFTQWNATRGTLTIRSDQPLEARANPLNPIQTKDLLTTSSTVPAVGPGDVLITTSLYGNNTVNLELRGTNGVYEDGKTLTAGFGMTSTPIDFGAYKPGKQLEIKPSAPLHAVLKTADGTLVPVVENRDARGYTYVFNAGSAAIKNADSGGIMGYEATFWPANQNNDTTALFGNNTLINYGMASIPDLKAFAKGTGPGVVQVKGGDLTYPDGKVIQQPHTLWNNGAVAFTRDDAALAKAGVSYDTTTPRNMSFNNASGTITLLNASDSHGTVKGTITGYKDDGTKTGELPYTLTWRENKTIDVTALGATRLTLSANDTVGDALQPTIIASVNGEKGYGIARPIVKVTGEEVVAQYLDPFKGQSFFFDNKMVRCMNTGDCGVPAIKSTLANIYTKGVGETWTQPQFENWLSTMTNGVTSQTDIELWAREDPLTYSGAAGVSYMLTSTQNTWTKEPGNIVLQGADLQNTYSTLRGFVVKYIDTHPELFGGNQTTGPSKERQHYTTFYTRDAN